MPYKIFWLLININNSCTIAQFEKVSYEVQFQVLMVTRGARVALSVYCLTMDWTTGKSRFGPRQKQKDFSSSLCVQTGSEAHPASCQMGTRGPFPESKVWPGHNTDHLPPSSAEVKNE
jgi:hypothetical protein